MTTLVLGRAIQAEGAAAFAQSLGVHAHERVVYPAGKAGLRFCINCNVCVQICPTNVFDAVPNQPPAIARQEDCQTCFICEAYCPADALYVAPESHTNVAVNEDDLIESGIMGEYRRTLGWGYGRKNNSELDTAHKLRQLPRPYQSSP